mmetsp:Transcript_70320/g.97763  ORF Transcript_70320/g.97763 Transcript_70320/m.97763 type:complete len:273 (-) Transcript_70320:139-957(-)
MWMQLVAKQQTHISHYLVRITSESTVNCSGVSRCDTLHICTRDLGTLERFQLRNALVRGICNKGPLLPVIARCQGWFPLAIWISGSVRGEVDPKRLATFQVHILPFKSRTPSEFCIPMKSTGTNFRHPAEERLQIFFSFWKFWHWNSHGSMVCSNPCTGGDHIDQLTKTDVLLILEFLPLKLASYHGHFISSDQELPQEVSSFVVPLLIDQVLLVRDAIHKNANIGGVLSFTFSTSQFHQGIFLHAVGLWTTWTTVQTSESLAHHHATSLTA